MKVLFAAAGSTEGQIFQKYDTLMTLSAKNIMDCVYGLAGCDGLCFFC
jgi:hypothetical protein